MPQLLNTLSRLLELDRPFLSADDLAGFADASRDALLNQKLLVPARSATHVVCDACHEGHVEEVVRITSGKGDVHFRICCPDAGWIEVPAERLRQWTIDVSRLVAALAAAMRLSGKCKSLEADHVWRCGRTVLQGISRDVLFVRGLMRRDAAHLRGAITRCTQPIVLVAAEIPPREFWTGRVPPVVAISEIVTLVDGQLDVDSIHLFAAIAEHENEGNATAGGVVTGRKQRLAIRRNVESVIKSMLGDDALVAAYKEHGTYRKAAEALSEQTGENITKDKVFRAVQRKGGAEAVVSQTNSNSVRRTVASQRRDRKKKIPNRPEAMDIP